MKRWFSIGWVAVAICASAACGDDSTPTTTATAGSAGTGGAGGAGGGGGAGGAGATDGGDTDGGDIDNPGGNSKTTGCTTIYDVDKIMYTPTTIPTYTCNGMKSTTYPNGRNACRNDADCAIINTNLVRNIVKNCALGCRSDPTCSVVSECNRGCVQMDTAKIMPPGISEACGKCYTEVAICSTIFCLSSCAADPDAIECVKCQFENGCRVPYERCSGLDRQ